VEKLLEVRGLTIHYETDASTVKAVNGVSFHIEKGETLGLVGETGAGKTTTALGILGILPTPPAVVKAGEILLEGRDLLKTAAKEMLGIRGKRISMIFQDPMTSLNPVFFVGDQIAEGIRRHEKIPAGEAVVKAQKMLELVGIPAERYREYPHQFSGGMKQRVIIAMALACNPELLIADEPTTALDVTIQAQVLQLMVNLKRELNTSMLLITHDLGVVAEVCDRVAILYAGEIVEMGSLRHIFKQTLHPYTEGLFGSLPKIHEKSRRLVPIPGLMPDPTHLPDGCAFRPRCQYAQDQCAASNPRTLEIEPGHFVKCLRYGGGEAQDE
jgi:peptide/nickel transport system ATP-binding protein